MLVKAFVESIGCVVIMLLCWYRVVIVQVPSLQELCRSSIRHACELRLLRYLKHTVMPSRLRSYILLQGILENFGVTNFTVEDLEQTEEISGLENV